MVGKEVVRVVCCGFGGRGCPGGERMGGEHDGVGGEQIAFKDYPGTIQQLASEIEIVESSRFLGIYGTEYKLRRNNLTKAPELFLKLNGVGLTEKFHRWLFRAGVK